MSCCQHGLFPSKFVVTNMVAVLIVLFCPMFILDSTLICMFFCKGIVP